MELTGLGSAWPISCFSRLTQGKHCHSLQELFSSSRLSKKYTLLAQLALKTSSVRGTRAGAQRSDYSSDCSAFTSTTTFTGTKHNIIFPIKSAIFMIFLPSFISNILQNCLLFSSLPGSFSLHPFPQALISVFCYWFPSQTPGCADMDWAGASQFGSQHLKNPRAPLKTHSPSWHIIQWSFFQKQPQ